MARGGLPVPAANAIFMQTAEPLACFEWLFQQLTVSSGLPSIKFDLTVMWLWSIYLYTSSHRRMAKVLLTL